MLTHLMIENGLPEWTLTAADDLELVGLKFHKEGDQDSYELGQRVVEQAKKTPLGVHQSYNGVRYFPVCLPMPPTKRTWLNQFGEEYAVPPEILNDPELEDCSWGNDAAPSFKVKGADDYDKVNLVLWSDHPDRSRRECVEHSRFSVWDLNKDADGDLYEGDDVNEAIRVLKEETRKRISGVA